jgi:hypothetical protein
LATGIPSSTASRAPGRPANTIAIDDSIRRNSSVYRACGRVRPSTCSANVTAAQRELLHLNRRTTNSITTGVSPTGVSRSRRVYRPCTRQDGMPHSGHRPGSVRHDVRNVTTPAARSTDSTTTPAICGSNRPKSPEPHTQLMPSSDWLCHKISDRAELRDH